MEVEEEEGIRPALTMVTLLGKNNIKKLLQSPSEDTGIPGGCASIIPFIATKATVSPHAGV